MEHILGSTHNSVYVCWLCMLFLIYLYTSVCTSVLMYGCCRYAIESNTNGEMMKWLKDYVDRMKNVRYVMYLCYSPVLYRDCVCGAALLCAVL